MKYHDAGATFAFAERARAILTHERVLAGGPVSSSALSAPAYAAYVAWVAVNLRTDAPLLPAP